MQYFVDGYRKGDPRVQPVAPGRTEDQPELPDEVDVLIVGTGPAGFSWRRSCRCSRKS